MTSFITTDRRLDGSGQFLLSKSYQHPGNFFFLTPQPSLDALTPSLDLIIPFASHLPHLRVPSHFDVSLSYSLYANPSVPVLLNNSISSRNNHDQRNCVSLVHRPIAPHDPKQVVPDVVTEASVMARMTPLERRRYKVRKRNLKYVERKRLGLVKADVLIRQTATHGGLSKAAKSSVSINECNVGKSLPDSDSFSHRSDQNSTTTMQEHSADCASDVVWRCSFCHVDNKPPFVPPYCSVCSYSLQKNRHRHAAEIAVSRYRASMSSVDVDVFDSTGCVTHVMNSSEINDSHDGPPDSSEGWAVDERKTVSAVTLNNIRHINGYFKSKRMSKERLMEVLNEKYLSRFQILDSLPTCPEEHSSWYMLFFRPTPSRLFSTSSLLRNLDLSSKESQKLFLHHICPAIQRSTKNHFYFIRGLDRTIHSAVGPLGFVRCCAESPYVIFDSIANSDDKPFDSKDPFYPIVANTDMVTVGEGVPFLKFLRMAFLSGSRALSLLGDSFPDVQECFTDVVGADVLIKELLCHSSMNSKRKCMQLHWGITCNEGGVWEKSSRASRRRLGLMSVVESFTPELRRWLVFMLVLETYVFKKCSLFPSADVVSDKIWSFCSPRYRECRKQMYEYMNGNIVPEYMCLADTSTICFGRQVSAVHTDKLNDPSPGQDGVSLFSSFFDLEEETSVNSDYVSELRKGGSDPNKFCMACIAYTRKAVGNQASKNQVDLVYDQPVFRCVVDLLCPDIPQHLKDTEWIEDCLVDGLQLKNLMSSFRPSVTSDWCGFAIKRKEGWSRDFLLSSILHGIYSFLFSHHSKMKYNHLLALLLFVAHDINGQPLCQLIFWKLRHMSTKEISRRLSIHGGRLYCVLCDVARELKPSQSNKMNMPSSSSNRFRAQNSLCSLYGVPSRYVESDKAINCLSVILSKVQHHSHNLTTAQVLKYGDSVLDDIIASDSLKGVSHLRGVLCIQVASGMQLISPDFFNYASVTNSLGPHKFFEKCTGSSVSRLDAKCIFTRLLRELRIRQPKLYPHVKGIENVCCLLGKEDVNGRLRASHEFLFCESGVTPDAKNFVTGTKADPMGVQNFFKWKDRTTAYPSELVLLHMMKWVPLQGLCRPFYGQKEVLSSSNFITFFDKSYQEELKTSCSTNYRRHQVMWASNLPPRYPQNAFGSPSQ